MTSSDRLNRRRYKMEEIFLPHDIYGHPNRDHTWDMDDFEIEDKIKELRKEIYRLKNSRKKQPKMAVFRKENLGYGDMRCHILHGFKIIDEKKNSFRADCWRPITEREAEDLKKKYDMKEEALRVIEETIKQGERK